MTTRPHALSQRFSRRLTLLAAAPFLLAGLFVIGVTLASAEDAVPTVTLRPIDRAPATPAAGRLYRQLDRAALAVCARHDPDPRPDRIGDPHWNSHQRLGQAGKGLPIG